MSNLTMHLFAVGIALTIYGCAGPGVTPRENFDQWLSSYVGQDLRKHENITYQLAGKDDIVGSQTLPNGNVENLYKLPFKHKSLPEHCIYAMEYDPKTFIIVKTRIERGIDGCYIVP